MAKRNKVRGYFVVLELKDGHLVGAIYYGKSRKNVEKEIESDLNDYKLLDVIPLKVLFEGIRRRFARKCIMALKDLHDVGGDSPKSLHHVLETMLLCMWKRRN